MRIGLLGWYGHHNVGDDALMEAVRADLLRAAPGAQVVIFADRPDAIERDFGLEAAPLLPISPMNFARSPRTVGLAARAWRRLDTLVLGGGGFFADDVSARNVVKWSSYILGSKAAGKQVLTCGIGVGPIRRPACQRLARLAFQAADGVSVRDEESREWLRRCGVSREVHVTGDPVLGSALPEVDVTGVERAAGLEPGQPFVALSVPPFFHDSARWPGRAQAWEDYREAWVGLCEAALARGVTPLFVPMQHPSAEGGLHYSDLEFARDVAGRVGSGVRVVRDYQGPAQVAALLRRAGLVMAVRFHALVLAARADVAVAGVVYHHKAGALARRLGIEDAFLPVEQVSRDRLVPLFERAWSERERLRAQLRDSLPAVAASAACNLELLARWLGSRSDSGSVCAEPA